MLLKGFWLWKSQEYLNIGIGLAETAIPCVLEHVPFDAWQEIPPIDPSSIDQSLIDKRLSLGVFQASYLDACWQGGIFLFRTDKSLLED